jgi:hypothetical protein
VTGTTAPPTAGEPTAPVDPGLAEGRSRLLLFAGMGVLAVGALVAEGSVVWAGVVAIALAFALNTAGKLVHYRGLSIPAGHKLRLSASWLALAATVVGALGTFAHTRYGAGDDGFLLPLALAGVGFALLHMAAQSKYLPATVDGAEPADS